MPFKRADPLCNEPLVHTLVITATVNQQHPPAGFLLSSSSIGSHMVVTSVASFYYLPTNNQKAAC